MKALLSICYACVLLWMFNRCASAPETINESCSPDEELCEGRCVAVGTCGEDHSESGVELVDSAKTASSICSDAASANGSLSGAYQGAMITAAGAKSYYLQSNWWFLYDKQSIAYNGLSFTVSNPTNAAVDAYTGSPIGYPSFFVGSYAGHATSASNLPRKVSDIASIPTVFATNATQKGIENHNAAFDVWFTPDASLLSNSQYSPPPGGAYLMIWLFDPERRQPRGSNLHPGQTVEQAPGTWDVWIHATNPPCISYVSTTPLDTLEVDLNSFIRDSVDNGYGITGDMYLNLVFAGFEIWGGGDGLSVNRFCIQVN
ncbi:MAG: hypothetical protein JXA30_13780 [Deltaproteobacteria bacterium]|nr:hypothetical protein [Deltaproteobacteria bacterium]